MNDDELLEAALAAYGNAEPRPGLESRVLARIKAEKRGSTAFGWIALNWAALSWIALMAMAAGTAVVFWWPSRLQNVALPKPQAVRAALLEPERAVTAEHVVLRRKRIPRLRRKRIPTLEKFPRKSPLTEEERLLVQLVEQKPQQAKSLLAERSSASIEPIQIRELQMEQE